MRASPPLYALCHMVGVSLGLVTGPAPAPMIPVLTLILAGTMIVCTTVHHILAQCNHPHVRHQV